MAFKEIALVLAIAGFVACEARLQKDSDVFTVEVPSNELESQEFVDKYNNYGKTFDFNTLDKRFKKLAAEKSLGSDTVVNYIGNNRRINEDSELVSGLPDQPPKDDTTMMARYVVHAVDWTVLGTVSTREPTKGDPFVCAKATTDGFLDKSTGVPYFYMSALDLCTQDLQANSKVSALFSLAQTDYCKNKKLDPQDPRCARLSLSGNLKRLEAGSEEEKFAKEALFARHPAMKRWPTDHNWFFTKLDVEQVVLLDRFGGATYVDVKDYFNVAL